MIKIENEGVFLRELLVVARDADRHTREVLCLGDGGELLFARENECCAVRELFRIDKDEYLQKLAAAAKSVCLQKSISKGTTSIEVLYKGKYFRAGSSVRYMVQSKECSVFTSDMALAEEYDFCRIDKFEYEKTLRIADCDAVRVTHIDAESDNVLVSHELSPTEFEEWLDTVNRSAD